MTAPHAPILPPDVTAPSVFISYSHDSESHKAWVLRLAGDLRELGVNADVDHWLRLGEDLPTFMTRSVLESDRVLLVCTENYVNKAENGVGGVGFEARIVSAELARRTDTRKFVPVVREKKGPRPLPAYLGARLYIDFSDDAAYPDRLAELARELHGVDAPSRPPLGRNPYATASSPSPGRGPSVATSASGRQTAAAESPPRDRPRHEADVVPGNISHPGTSHATAHMDATGSSRGGARMHGGGIRGLRAWLRAEGQRLAPGRRTFSSGMAFGAWLSRGRRALHTVGPRLHIHLMNGVTAVLPLLVLSADTGLSTWATGTVLPRDAGQPAQHVASRFAPSTPAPPSSAAGLEMGAGESERLEADASQPKGHTLTPRETSPGAPAAAAPRGDPRTPERRPAPPPREPYSTEYGSALDEIHAARSAYERGDYPSVQERMSATSQQLQSLADQFPGSQTVRQLQDSVTALATRAQRACHTELKFGQRQDCD